MVEIRFPAKLCWKIQATAMWQWPDLLKGKIDYKPICFMMRSAASSALISPVFTRISGDRGVS